MLDKAAADYGLDDAGGACLRVVETGAALGVSILEANTVVGI